MPHHRHHRSQRGSGKDETNNNETSVVEGTVQHNDNQPAVNRHSVVSCCMPSGCLCSEESIDPSDAGDAVKVVCNNEACAEGTWMHKVCFDDWEDGVLAYLKSCGRARSWSEKQRLQNLWTKKGYDLAFKACDCRCGRGHLRKDLDYIPPPKNDNARKHKKKTKKNDRPMPVVTSGKSGSHNVNHSNVNHGHHVDGNLNVSGQNGNRNNQGPNIVGLNINANTIRNRNNSSSEPKLDNANANRNVTGILNPPNKNSTGSTGKNNDNNTGSANSISKPINTSAIVRPRTDSLGSTGSSSVISTGSSSPTPSPPRNGNNVLIRAPKPKFDTCSTDSTQTSFSNIFRRRHDLAAFNMLPRHKQNPYHIKMEDDGPPGNDETRSFVLNHLSTYKVSSLNCVLCMCSLPVFDRYPMIDGTFFLSPQAYGDGVVQVISEGRLQFINAVCVNCLEGASNVQCTACKRKWDGSTLLLGSMYSYDIFAAMPCCQKRLTCKHCRRAVVDINNGLAFYSEYSRMIACPYCKAHDYHFIRPMQETFAVKPYQPAQQQPIWN
ncbi:headcase protein homolog [Pecten maximus]|uniref:headcase protein homolog n=1 Tax=Pecten maximus TaxID=6579 RepID=UPI0014587FE6|nr:headcase protein homolog [Pecten maximus]